MYILLGMVGLSGWEMVNRSDIEKDVDGESGEGRVRAFKPHYIEQPQAASKYVCWSESDYHS